jgi:hypothetical protein
MNDLRAAAQQALEALEQAHPKPYNEDVRAHVEAITALRAALAQEEQEPVAWGVDWGRDGNQSCCTIIKRRADGAQEVVAVEYGPPRREWKGLTDQEIGMEYVKWDATPGASMAHFARAIEAALKERNA